MKKVITFTLIFFLFLSNRAISQSIEIESFNQNPLEVSALLGANLTIDYKYSGEIGTTSNHIYIGLEILDSNNNYVSTVSEQTLQNQQSGSNIQKSVSFFISSSHKLSSDLPNGQYYQVKAILYTIGWNEIAWAGYWNTPKLILQNTSNYNFSSNIISKGADISWMSEMESQGFIWKDNAGITKELMPLLKEYNLDAVRLRVWVNPENTSVNGWCDIDDMIRKAVLAKSAGLDIMLTIHYSDSWADPGKQNKPAAWVNMAVSELETTIYNHTTAILNALQQENITPKWIQIGNETNDGLLWPTGKASTNGFVNYAKFLNAGANAVKTFNNNIKTIIHLSNGNDNELFKWNIGGLINNGLTIENFDIIGLSLYPSFNDWKELVDDAYANMTDLKSRYNKDVMLVEVGSENNRPDIAYQFLLYAIEKTKEVGGLGVFYWEPIAHKNWKSYSKGAWDEDGSPSIAMDAFIDKSTLNINTNNFEELAFKIYPNPTSEILQINSLERINSVKIYDLKGSLLKVIKNINAQNTIDISNLSTGIYFLEVNHKKQLKFIKQ
ncbi:MAG: glycosyl hydrolase 53 family protein [Polaribacter sp.]|uniref:glycosyl hydrolase 53 family protein n=1 Tax=Polaribacter sp. TaxID=1920175 RepID=UPI003BB14F9D